MKFLSNLFSKKLVQPIKELTLEEAISISEEKLKNVDLKEDIALIEKIKMQIKASKKALEELGKAVITQETFKKLKDAAIESRNQLVIKISKSLDSVEFSSGQNMIAIESTSNSLQNCLKEIATGNFKHGYYINLVFKDPTQNLGKELRILENLSNQLKTSIEKKQKNDEIYHDILNLQKEINDLNKQITGDKSKFESKKQLPTTNCELQTSNCGLNSNIIKLETEVKKITENTDLLRNEIYGCFAKLSRALKKYENITALEKPLQEKVKNYIDNPVATAVKDEDMDILKILDGAEKCIKSNELELKDKDKVIEAIAKIRTEEFREEIEKYKIASRELEEKTLEMHDLKRKQDESTVQARYEQEQQKKIEDEIKALDEKIKHEMKLIAEKQEELKGFVVDLSRKDKY